MLKTDGDGNLLWSCDFGGPSYDMAWDVKQTADSGFVLIGYTWSYGAGMADVWLIKTGPDPVQSPDFDVDLIPVLNPIQIPASGGTFDFYAFVTNGASFLQAVDLWTKEIAPDGSIIGPLLGPATVQIDPGTRGWFRHQNVPGTAAPGLYTYIGYAGNYSTGNIWATDSLQFTKLTTGDGPWVSDWSCTGEEITPVVGAHGCAPSSGSEATPTMEVLPNPFNPTTAISYQLSANSYVSLLIYNTAGRLVATLVDGWREAGTQEVTFDGSGLPSGIYFAKLAAGDFHQVQKLALIK
jgi:hypothetical protein